MRHFNLLHTESEERKPVDIRPAGITGIKSYCNTYCTASTHLCFGRCAVTGGLRCALHCLPAYAQMRELKAGKPSGSQEGCPCRQDCCRPGSPQCRCTRGSPSCRRAQHGKSLTRHPEDR